MKEILDKLKEIVQSLEVEHGFIALFALFLREESLKNGTFSFQHRGLILAKRNHTK